jgi:hypothetical protein
METFKWLRNKAGQAETYLVDVLRGKNQNITVLRVQFGAARVARTLLDLPFHCPHLERTPCHYY